MRSGPRRRPGKCRFGYYSPLGVGGDGRDVHTDPDGTVHGRADREREREPDRRCCTARSKSLTSLCRS